MSTSKRSSPDSESNMSGGRESPFVLPKRQKLIDFEPVKLSSMPSVCMIEQMTVQFQAYKLSERLRIRTRIEQSLNQKIAALERRQTQDDAVLCIINRYWNRLDEDVRILLMRFDAEASDVKEQQSESKATRSFLELLSQGDHDATEKSLDQRVEFSRRALSKLVGAFDRLSNRSDNISRQLHQLTTGQSIKSEIKTEIEEDTKVASDVKAAAAELNKEVCDVNEELRRENKRLQELVTKLQTQNHKLTLQHSKLEDEDSAAETKVEELKNKVDEAVYELEKSIMREEKVEYRCIDLIKQIETLELQVARAQTNPGVPAVNIKCTDDMTNLSKTKLEELQAELDEQKELAGNRLTELTQLKDRLAKALCDIERLNQDLNHIPSKIIHDSTEYKCLQSQFSVLLEESRRVVQHLAEAKQVIHSSAENHAKQIEQMETEELMAQKQLRMEMLSLEDQLSQVRREYEMLRLEFEQNLAANEQSGPLNREMRQLLQSYKNQNTQLKSEAARFKKKWKEAISTIAKVQKELENERKLKENAVLVDLGEDEDRPESPDTDNDEEHGSSYDKIKKHLQVYKDKCKQLTLELEKVHGLSAEERNKVTLMATETRLLRDIEKLKRELSRIVRQDRRERGRYLQEEGYKKIKRLEEQLEKFKEGAAMSKQEEDTLLNEMEVTGQAFEEQREQNTRLVQQLKEKDDANFKLMSERIRSNQQQKKLKEEKELIEEQVAALHNQVAAQNLVVRKLEEKERALNHTIGTQHKEIQMRQQADNLYKKKALENSQTSADLKLQHDKLVSQLSEVQAAVCTKTAAFEDLNFKISRFQEEASGLKRRLEQAKKLEKVENLDEVLMEEIRELKTSLTCPSCKVNRKDAILTKCLHVFCMECMKTRYDTRRRKCPKCNAAFGANDYKRIYIS